MFWVVLISAIVFASCDPYNDDVISRIPLQFSEVKEKGIEGSMV